MTLIDDKGRLLMPDFANEEHFRTDQLANYMPATPVWHSGLYGCREGAELQWAYTQSAREDVENWQRLPSFLIDRTLRQCHGSEACAMDKSVAPFLLANRSPKHNASRALSSRSFGGAGTAAVSL